MNFSELKTKLGKWTASRTDISSELGDFINSVIHNLEKKNRWKHMFSKTTGNFTTTVDYVSIPTGYKEMKFAFITVDNQQKRLVKKSYETMIGFYPDGSAAPGVPVLIATAEWDSKFYVRPYPAGTYPYEIVSYNYTTDLSADTDTNWWTNNAHEILIHGSLMEVEKRTLSPIQYPDGTTPTQIFNSMLDDLIKTSGDEEIFGSPQYTVTDWVIGA